jgi:hypothetical protein
MAQFTDSPDDQGLRDIVDELNPAVTALGNKTGAITITHSSANDVKTLTLTGNVTLTLAAATGTTAGDLLTLIISQDGTGSRLITWPATAKLAGGAVTLTTTATTGKDLLQFVFDGTNWNETGRSLALAATA